MDVRIKSGIIVEGLYCNDNTRYSGFLTKGDLEEFS